jgi:hypothetical protein
MISAVSLAEISESTRQGFAERQSSSRQRDLIDHRTPIVGAPVVESRNGQGPGEEIEVHLRFEGGRRLTIAAPQPRNTSADSRRRLITEFRLHSSSRKLLCFCWLFT